MAAEPSLTIHGPSRQVEWTVKAYAERWQVTPRTVANWIRKGAILPSEIVKTRGGQIRIVDKSVIS